MTRTRVTLAATLALLSLGAERSDSVALFEGWSLRPRAKIEYFLLSEETRVPFLWNYAGSSPLNDSRIMLDADATSDRYGELYLKGSASWQQEPDSEGRRRLLFEQGHYSLGLQSGRHTLSVALFSNERRFFTGDYLGPLTHDDPASLLGDNRGALLEYDLSNLFRLRSLFSMVGHNWKEGRKLSFLECALSSKLGRLSLSYLYARPGEGMRLHQALLKGELALTLEKATLLLSYEQSGFEESGPFVPWGAFHPDRISLDELSAALPPEGAFLAELRLGPFSSGRGIDTRLIWEYFALGSDFRNDFGELGGGSAGYRVGAHFRALDFDLDGRLTAGKAARWGPKQGEEEGVDASITGRLRSGVGFTLRGRGLRTRGDGGGEKRTLLLGADFGRKRARGTFYLLFEELGSHESRNGLGWDNRFVLGGHLAVDLRMALLADRAVRSTVFARLELRPTKHLFAYLAYGPGRLTDGPFMFEDRDIGLLGIDTSIYTVYLRGDF